MVQELRLMAEREEFFLPASLGSARPVTLSRRFSPTLPLEAARTENSTAAGRGGKGLKLAPWFSERDQYVDAMNKLATE